MTNRMRRRGWFMQSTDHRIRRFHVVGERASGTNYINRLLVKNTPLIPADGLAWKHGFPSMIAIPSDVCVFCIFRDVRDWVLSMHARPWHCSIAMQALDFSSFIRAEWETIIDRKRYFPQACQDTLIGAPLQADRNPATGDRFANIFALRRAKMSASLTYLSRGCSVYFVRYEALAKDPEAFLRDVKNSLDLTNHEPFRPITRRLGNRFKPAIQSRPETPRHLSQGDLRFALQQIDLSLEKRVGYLYETGL
ncbi:hypothetical protein J1C49_04690 [Cognatishimia sp. F0-27]|nr:hypothetical protein [Cognatishimia sp. F0-27]